MLKNRFVLIDAFALIFRAYYALPPSLTKDGHSIAAAYGFTSALLSSIKTLQPEYLAVGMDKGKSHRTEDFIEYKAHRAPVPDDLMSQVPYVCEVLKTMNIPTFAVEGYEGEDVLATIVAKTKDEVRSTKMEYILVTGDMDLLQLIDENIKVYSMARGVNQAQMYDIEKVKERYGLTPAQFVDYKALKGDASDNIPGVPGIGEKTASSLIKQFGSLEKLYELIKDEVRSTNKMQKNAKISEKVIKILTENKDQAFLSQKLSKIRDDVPLEFNLAEAKVHDFEFQKTANLFTKLGFKSLIPRLPEALKKEDQQKLF